MAKQGADDTARRRKLTWSDMGVEPDERAALRRAGLTPADLLRVGPLDVVAMTDDSIGEPRAAHLVARASLLAIMSAAKVETMERLGVRDRSDLATRSVDELFCRLQGVSAYTNPNAYDFLGALVEAARGAPVERTTTDWWLSHRQREGIDAVAMAWTARFGELPNVRPTDLRLVIDRQRVRARVVVTRVEGSAPVPPLSPDEVAADSADAPSVLVGHWQWGGRHGPFLRLERLSIGDYVELASAGCTRGFSVTETRRGLAPIEVDAAEGQLVLTTPPHLRWADWLRDWEHPAHLEAERDWVQVAVVAEARGGEGIH